jgi:hypothetical protein
MKLASISAVLLCTFLFIGLGEAAQRGGQWQLLGEQEVNFKNDHDRIDVKRRAGPFRELRIEVRDAPIEIHDMTVTFADHKTFKPNIRARFREGRGSHVIDLPGNRRSIDKVEFVYRSIDRRQGKGKVLLYAR